MVKKGFIRTVEAVIAIIITFLLIAIMLSRQNMSEEMGKTKLDLSFLSQNNNFRNCYIKQDVECLSQIIKQELPIKYKERHAIQLCISNNTEYPNCIMNFNSKNVFTESIFISSNITDYMPGFVKVYYWED